MSTTPCPSWVHARGWAVPAEEPSTTTTLFAVRTIPPVEWTPQEKLHRREAREQAYVPAEQPPPPQGAWFPPAHAHPRRPLDPVGASPQGPQQPGRLTAAPAAITLVLPAAHRLIDSDSFRITVRAGRRCGSTTLVVHLDVQAPGQPARVGFVVSKAVGNSVTRNRVQRRLRHLSREHLAALPASTALVVRALPAAAGASSRELGADLSRCLQRVSS